VIGIQGSVPFPPQADPAPIVAASVGLASAVTGLVATQAMALATNELTQGNWAGAASTGTSNQLSQRIEHTVEIIGAIEATIPALETLAAAVTTAEAAYTAAAMAEQVARAGLPWTSAALAAAITEEVAAVAGLEAAGAAAAAEFGAIAAVLEAMDFGGIADLGAIAGQAVSWEVTNSGLLPANSVIAKAIAPVISGAITGGGTGVLTGLEGALMSGATSAAMGAATSTGATAGSATSTGTASSMGNAAATGASLDSLLGAPVTISAPLDLLGSSSSTNTGAVTSGPDPLGLGSVSSDLDSLLGFGTSATSVPTSGLTSATTPTPDPTTLTPDPTPGAAPTIPTTGDTTTPVAAPTPAPVPAPTGEAGGTEAPVPATISGGDGLFGSLAWSTGANGQCAVTAGVGAGEGLQGSLARGTLPEPGLSVAANASAGPVDVDASGQLTGSTAGQVELSGALPVPIPGNVNPEIGLSQGASITVNPNLSVTPPTLGDTTLSAGDAAGVQLKGTVVFPCPTVQGIIKSLPTVPESVYESGAMTMD
jgi:hypothetical protein